MSSDSSCNMWVFREGRSVLSGGKVLEDLRHSLGVLATTDSEDQAVDALLRAGELECALADAASPHAERVAQLTDRLAEHLLGRNGSDHAFASLLDGVTAPESVSISTAEGFAYYALHPVDFAELAISQALAGPDAAVIGIRSIGTTLSAVVAAALRQHGWRAERMTVRPAGHPFNRQTCFDEMQLRWIAKERARAAQFVVVDEGPGISGSSFLSVGDALLQAGVERSRIIFLCSRSVHPDDLAARDGAARWKSFRSVASGPTRRVPEAANVYIGGGDWRRRVFAEELPWPASWTQMERLKFLSVDHDRMFKFVGLGRFGKDIANRARVLAEAGFGPELLNMENGFAEYRWLPGAPMSPADASTEVLERIADYCAMRAVEFQSGMGESQLERMVGFNVAEEFGAEFGESAGTLAVERPVLADGRMLPHEWLRTGFGRLLKTDGTSHGDDHFFPGRTDIAWDLAGAIIEWNLGNNAIDFMLERYRRRAGEDPRHRIASYMLAYSVFRMAYCAMAAYTMRGSAEEPRLRRAWRHYRSVVAAQIKATRPIRLRAQVQRTWLPQATGEQAAS